MQIFTVKSEKYYFEEKNGKSNFPIKIPASKNYYMTNIFNNND